MEAAKADGLHGLLHGEGLIGCRETQGFHQCWRRSGVEELEVGRRSHLLFVSGAFSCSSTSCSWMALTS